MSNRNQRSDTRKHWFSLGARLGAITLLYPFSYARTLMQLGYEPWPPESGRNMFGQRILRLPNLLQYVGHIGAVSGFCGCYHGLTPRLIDAVVTYWARDRFAELVLGPPPPSLNSKPLDEITQQDIEENFQVLLRRDLQLLICGVIVAHPFQVISLRMMAQFMSGDRNYLGVFATIIEICQHDGFFGFYGGLAPRLCNDICCLVLSRYMLLLARKYILQDDFSQAVCGFGVRSLVATIFYPFRLVSICMAVNSAMYASNLFSTIPYYHSSTDCWLHLQARKELRRGDALFFRTLNEEQIRARKRGKISAFLGM